VLLHQNNIAQKKAGELLHRNLTIHCTVLQLICTSCCDAAET